MAQLVLDSKIIQRVLETMRDELEKGIAWARKKEGKVTLNVPEPWDHSVETPPYDRTDCTPLDECGEIAVLIGVMEQTKKQRK